MEVKDNNKEIVKKISEGKAVIQTRGEVFYNPVQEFNRDLSVAVLNVFSEEQSENLKIKENVDKGITIFEALSATGLRSIRYAKEVVNVQKILANDLSSKAVQDIKENIIINNVENIIDANQSDAIMVMYKHRKPSERFSALDLDPYGCPAIFLDGAVQCVEDGGILLVTATDMAVLAGNTPETCYYKYGAVSLRLRSCHEMALRILLQCIESHANRYGRYIKPLLSISADFYIRVFVKIFTGPSVCKNTTKKLSYVFECVGCETFYLHPIGGEKLQKNSNNVRNIIPVGIPVGEFCEHCGSKFRMGGPIWSNPIHDQSFVSKIIMSNLIHLNTWKRIQGVLNVILEELDTPLYYTLDRLCGKIHIETPSMMKVRSAILNAGYKVSFSHAHKLSIKTNASSRLIWDILRDWEKQHPVNRTKLSSEDVAIKLLSQTKSEIEINWDMHPFANPESRKLNLLRFQENPEANWGPGMRATAMIGQDKLSKSRRNQGKHGNKRKKTSMLEEKDCKQKISDVL